VGIQVRGRQGRVGGVALSTLRARGIRVPIYITVQWDHQHSDNAPLWCKRLVLNAVNILPPDSLVKHDMPSMLQLTLNPTSEPRSLDSSLFTFHSRAAKRFARRDRGRDFVVQG
jgi:hypothetical protein